MGGKGKNLTKKGEEGKRRGGTSGGGGGQSQSSCNQPGKEKE